MDVVWMLGNGSRHNDWELRFSMRSFFANYACGSTPWIIGHVPSWIDADLVRCIHWPDPYKRVKDANLLNKAVRLAGESELSDRFILCSDDHLLLRRSTPEEFLFWHCGPLPTRHKKPSEWQSRLMETRQRLKAQGFSTWNFEGHIPYYLDKSWVFNALRFDYGVAPGMTVFSTILNCAGVEARDIGSERVRGWLGAGLSTEQKAWKLANNQFGCLNNESMQDVELISMIEELFPQPAPWEKE